MAKKVVPTAPVKDVDEQAFTDASDKRRVADVSAARTIFDTFVKDNSLRSMTFAQTRNQLEGGRPFDPVALREQGMEWQTNVNFGDSQASRDRAAAPFWKMINSAPNRAAFQIASGSPDTEQWQAAFAECFDMFLKDWGASYFIQFQIFVLNFVNFGPGIVQWVMKGTPRFEAVNVQRLYFPKNASMDPDKWEVLALERDMTASELYTKVSSDKASKKSALVGWNPDAIKKLLVEMSNTGERFHDGRDYTRVQDKLVNNDIAGSTDFQPSSIVFLYVKDFEGKIACYAFSRRAGVDDFIFKDEDLDDDFRHILGPVWYDTGTDGMVHSIKGFGIKNYFFSALQNRMKSRFVDGGTMSMAMNFQYANEGTPTESPPVENFGTFTVFPANLKQLQLYPNLQQAVSVIEMLANNQSENNGLYRQASQQIQNSDTATQANILANMAGELSESSATMFLSQVGDNIFTEQVRRLRIKGSSDKDAKKFVERMKLRGVPDEVIFNTELKVSTAANAKDANPALRAQMFQQDMAIASSSGMNLRWFQESYIANRYGANAVGKALLPEGSQSNPLQRREAMIENTMFGQGQPLPVDPSDAHFEHAMTHLGPLQAIVAKYQQTQQISPEETTALALGTEHTGEHMGFLQQDETKKAQFQQVLPTFRLVQSTARGILTKVQNAQQQNAPAPQGAGNVVPMTG